MVLIDNSDSMNECVFHNDYNPAVTYSGNFATHSFYSIPSSGSRTPKSFNNGWPNTPTAYLVSSDGGKPGSYNGNYLNWVYFHATATEVASIPTYTKIQAAKSVVSSMLGNVTSARFAIEVYNNPLFGGSGGTILCPFGTSVATEQSTVNAISTGYWTPLAESAVTTLNYFSTTGVNAPIQSSCQKSFYVIVTDGMPTQDAVIPAYLLASDCGRNDPGTCAGMDPAEGYPESYNCRAYLDNVACWMYRNDLRPDLTGIQNVATYVVGFQVDNPFLQACANVGGGEYFSTYSLAGLAASLNEVINSITQRVASNSSVAVISAEDRDHDRLYRARYETGTWDGHVEAFSLPFQAGAPPLWDAGSQLVAGGSSSRTIKTSTDGSNLTDFTTSNASTLIPYLTAASLSNAQDIIAYVRGDSVSGTRSRGGWMLGDIVDAAPVAIGKPTGFSRLAGFDAFRTANASRSEVLYVGANDGMLHCFNASNGNEMWAYIPRTQLSRVKNLMSTGYCHQYFVDTTPTAYDLPIGGQWKTVLFGGEEASGNGMYALDITSPTDGPSLLWDVNVPGLKGSTNRPVLASDPVSRSQVLCVGTGYCSASSSDSLVVLNPATGAVLQSMQLGSAVAGNKTTRAVAVDTDFNGYDDYLYIGDLAGNLWRVNLDTNPWTKTLFFSGTQPIQGSPVVTLNSMGRPMVFFATGQYVTASDISTTTTQAIYGIVDNGTNTTCTVDSLVNQTSAIQAVAVGKRGWYLNLANASGERATQTPALINGTLYVTSFQPSSDACSGGGQSWLYSLDYKDGSAPDHKNGTSNNTTAGRSQSMGDGVLSEPTVDLLNQDLLLQSSNAVVMSESVDGGLNKLVLRGWHRKWN